MKPELARALWIGLALTAIAVGLWQVPRDDGLRHVGAAFGPERSWGEIYPSSVFAEIDGYDPWGGYDRALRAIAGVAQALPISPLAQRLLVVKALGVTWVLALLVLAVRRARIEDALDDPPSIACAFAVTISLLAAALHRACLIRPFLLGTLVLVYAVGRRGFARGALASGIVLAGYPYLGFLYVGPLALAHFLRGSRSFAGGALGAGAAWLVLVPQAQWTLLSALAQANFTRAAMGAEIGELRSAASLWWLLAVLLALGALIAPRLPAEARRLDVAHILALCFVPAALLHGRYLGDVVMVLLFVAYGRDLTRLLRALCADTAARWRALRSADLVLPEVDLRPPASEPPRRGVARRALLAAAYAACALALPAVVASQYAGFARTARELSRVPHGARVLTEFNLQYELLFVRPDLALVPSCEIGLPSARVRAPYIAFFAAGRVCELARAVGASHFVEARGMYLDPRDVACLRGPLSDARLRVFAVEP